MTPRSAVFLILLPIFIFSSADAFAAHRRARPIRREVRIDSLTISRWMVTPLDLPIRNTASASRPAGLASNISDDGDMARSEFAGAVGAWGSQYLNKKTLEEHLGGGKTVPAPLVHTRDIQFYLLFPAESVRSRELTMPVAGMIRLGIFGQPTAPTDEAPVSDSNASR